VQRLLGVISVGCDGRPAAAVRQALGGESLLQRAARAIAEAGCDRVVVSLPDGDLEDAVLAAGLEPRLRPAGAHSLEAAVADALDAEPPAFTHVLVLDPLIPLGRPGRLAQAIRLAWRERADCVFSCHRESALLWHRSEMGLVPYFDPARRPGLGTASDDLPWLKEDGGFYLLDVACFRRSGSRHGGRIAPLVTEAAEAVLAADAAGLAVCRALLAERERAGQVG
jgi:hypothetical protein